MNQEDYYPLVDAIKGGDLAPVESFLQTPGVDVDFLFEALYDRHRYTPLSRAIHFNHQTIVEVLLAHGAAVNGPVGATKTPLQQACAEKNANEDTVKLLLEQGADVDGMTDIDRQTPLTLACYSKNNLGIIQLLINAGAGVNGGGGVFAPLHEAATFGNTEATELLIQSGADVNILSTEEFYDLPAGSTPLNFTASLNNSHCLSTLLAAGADPNIADERGQTPLHLADYDDANTLLAAGADPLHRDNQGRTPLQRHYSKARRSGFSAKDFNIITALVAAGDRSWECVPTPCPGLEAAMLFVWQAASDELPELFKRLKNPPNSLIELFPRMDNEMKKVVQEVLRGLHRHFSSYPHLKEQLLKSIFGLATF